MSTEQKKRKKNLESDMELLTGALHDLFLAPHTLPPGTELPSITQMWAIAVAGGCACFFFPS
jgi:hypothetical protein